MIIIIMMMTLCVQVLMENDERRAADMLLDMVTDKLDGDDRTAFDQLVYALVHTDQLECASKLDKELTEKHLSEKGTSQSHFAELKTLLMYTVGL